MRLPDDEDYAVEVMQRYLDLGGNLIDTARVYGESEKLVGRAIKGRREEVYLSTKNHAMGSKEYSPDLWKQYMETSCETLGVQHIDFYHVHDTSWEKIAGPFQEPGGPLEICQQALDEGIIGHLCFSSHDTPENIIKIIDTGLFDGMIVQYNLLDCSPGAGGHAAGAGNEPAIAHAREKGMGVLIMGPVAGGRLAMGAESGRLQVLLTQSTTSIPDLALRYVLANPGVTSAMSGMNTIEMVEENCASASHEQSLTDAEYQQIRAIVEGNEKLAGLYCTGCNYCQPCPQGVAIPKIFEAMNYHRIWGLTEHAKNIYAKLGEANAEACVECGECEEKCPQNIPIIQRLKESHETLSE